MKSIKTKEKKIKRNNRRRSDNFYIPTSCNFARKRLLRKGTHNNERFLSTNKHGGTKLDECAAITATNRGEKKTSKAKWQIMNNLLHRCIYER